MGECGCVNGPDFVFMRGRTQAIGIEADAGCTYCDAGPGVIVWEASGPDGEELMDHRFVVPASAEGMEMWGIEFIGPDALHEVLKTALMPDPHIQMGVSGGREWDETDADVLAESLRDVVLEAMSQQIHEEIRKRQAEITAARGT